MGYLGRLFDLDCHRLGQYDSVWFFRFNLEVFRCHLLHIGLFYRVIVITNIRCFRSWLSQSLVILVSGCFEFNWFQVLGLSGFGLFGCWVVKVLIDMVVIPKFGSLCSQLALGMYLIFVRVIDFVSQLRLDQMNFGAGWVWSAFPTFIFLLSNLIDFTHNGMIYPSLAKLYT